MPALNKVMLIGHLGRDPEIRYTATGSPVCNFSLATSEKWTDKAGEKKEQTQWHRVSVWGSQGESASKMLTKGACIYVEGKITYSEYMKDDEKKYSTDIVAHTWKFMSGKQKSDNAGKGAPPENEVPF